jgi:two-component system cell cycle sensor histidine kinase/response regulator CckA
VARKTEKRTSSENTPQDRRRRVSDVTEGRPGRAVALRQRYAALRTDSSATSPGPSVDALLTSLIDICVPQFCDWCEITLIQPQAEMGVFAVRNADGLLEGHQRVAQRDHVINEVIVDGHTEVWSDTDGELPCCVVIGMRVNDEVFAAVTLVVNERDPGYGHSEIEAIQDVVWGTATAIERVQLLQNAREAVRHTQRVASQLHQLIATSITVAGLRSEQEILTSLASSTRSVFDADTAVVSLESGSAAPLAGVAHRGEKPRSIVPGEVGSIEQFPHSRVDGSATWTDQEWLVAPLLERRGVARGVVAIRRGARTQFATEDREVLTLLAQMAATALGAAELSRTIQHNETRWRILVETAPVGIVEVSHEGHVEWWNRGAARIFAWPEYDESTGPDVAGFPDGATEKLNDLWADVREGNFASGRDFDDIEIRGRRRDLTASAALLPSVEGATRNILALIDDVTDHRELTSELRHAHQMEIRGQVASRVAHDFNNLLTLISGYAEILSGDAALDDRAAQMVREIQTTASRATSLTVQLQSIGRTKAPEPVVISARAAMSSIGEVLERIVGGDIELVWSFNNAADSVRVDADQFEQMVLNLSLNARDAMPSGGALRISVDSREIGTDEALELNVTPGTYVLISVADTGIGMNEETRARCFEPLFTTKGPFKGTGLGLASARRLVEDSAGSIRCRSEVGAGTTFEIFLPAANQHAREEPLVEPAPMLHRPATILLAEDDDALRRLVVQALERDGYLVLESNSAELALELARDFDGIIDLLVSDVVMELISGNDLALALQASNPELGVVLMSGTADESILDGLVPGTSAFLAKPFRPSALMVQVHSLLALRDTH